MALKALMLRKKISEATKKLEELRAKDADFEKREAELEAAIEEAETDEEKEVVEAEIDEFEKEKKENEEAKINLEKVIADLEADLDEQETEEQDEEEEEPEEEKREVKIEMVTRDKLRIDEHFVKREDVKAFIDETRACMKEKRALTNVGLTIPTVMLELLRENIENYSVMYNLVNVKAVSGEARQVIMGGIPEGVWTDCCANLNELDMIFYDEEWGCWKVGGFYAICDATLEDSDINLANEMIRAIGLAIGFALDKAILYGTGTRMPLGVMTRLAQTSEPEGYPATARPWVDLHETNIKSIAASVTGVELFQELLLASSASKSRYGNGVKTWVMNETTKATLQAQAMSVNASGVIVSGVQNTMPVIGGNIVELNFLPDNVILGGFYNLYTLVERAGKKFATSEHVRFLQDQTVFKGTARYDGSPLIPEAFVAIGINGVTPDATMTFAPDVANETTTEPETTTPDEG